MRYKWFLCANLLMDRFCFLSAKYNVSGYHWFMSDNKQHTTQFGYQEIPMSEKHEKVSAVFESVAHRYDLMNDCMSFGLHRLWKRFTIYRCALHRGLHVLDLAGGTGDLTMSMSPRVGDSGLVLLSDINAAMLGVGCDRLLDHGLINNVQLVQADAETLPFLSHYFDRIVMGFGLRNVTDQVAALSSMYRVLKPGGFVVILEFSKPVLRYLAKLYDLYSFKVIPLLGKWITGDQESYDYLVESIRMHPDQATLQSLMEHVGFEDCRYDNLTGGIVAIHIGYKF